MAKKIALVSLGCSKNQVDSEHMLWLLDEAGYDVTPDPAECDAVVVNTCAFIDSAKSEGIENILELAQLKKEGKIKKIIVAGCMAERYREELIKEIPEVDALLGCGSVKDIVWVVEGALDGEQPSLFSDFDVSNEEIPRFLTTPPYTAYLKIADGCDNCCSYCVIPSIRGAYRSRPMEAVLNEAEVLVQNGAKEIIVIAQDITRYGLDLYGERRLAQLLDQLAQIEDLEWIRLHYLYPDGIDDGLIDVIAHNDNILRYLDIPIQHINNRVLSDMNRRGDSGYIDRLFTKLRDRLPGCVIRTSVIVGFPGETDEEFTELCDFLRKHKLERAGVFPYSREEGTPAAQRDDQIDEDTKNRRVEIVMGIQQGVMDGYNKSQKGKTIEVLCEGYDRYAGCYFGRSFAESPEIDGKVFFYSKKRVSQGKFVKVKVTGTIMEDLVGEIAE